MFKLRWISVLLMLCLLCSFMTVSSAEDEEGLIADFVEEAVEEVQEYELAIPDGVDGEVFLPGEVTDEPDDSSQMVMAATSGDSLESALPIAFGTTYDGAITDTNASDFYKVTLPSSGCMTFCATAKLEYVFYYLYDASGKQLWSNKPHWDTTTCESVITPELRLTAGVYYIAVKKSGRTGQYSFSVSFESAEESFAETGNGTNNSIETASKIAFDQFYRGQIAINDTRDFYSFTLPSSGCVAFSATAKMEYVNYYLYDGSGKQIWSSTPHWNTTTCENVTNQDLNLTSGTYCLSVKQSGTKTGGYSFSLSFESAEESYTETGNGTDNSMETANGIDFDEIYNGQIAINDAQDFYRLALTSSGCVVLSATAKMEYVYFYLYDDAGKQIWFNNPHWNTTTHEIVINPELRLKPGIYYIAVKQYSNRVGRYTFNLSFENAMESFEETGSDDVIDWPNEITTNITYRGQLGINDTHDFYAFTLSENMDLTIRLVAGCEYINITMYDDAGKQMWSSAPHWNTVKKQVDFSKETTLSAGSYRLCVHQNGKRTAAYTLELIKPDEKTPEPTNTVEPAVEPTAAPDEEPGFETVSINACDVWPIPSKVYSGKYIKPEPTVTYGGSLLAKGYDYVVSYSNNKEIGVATVTIKGIGSFEGKIQTTFTIKPKAVKLTKLSAGKNQLKVNWKKGVGGVTGYQLQYSLKRNFTTIKEVMINKGSTIKTTLKNLKSKKTYYVRIRAFKKIGSKKYYSKWSEVLSKKTK